MKKLVIFDLDGTLLNTIADLAAATNQALQYYGYPIHDTDAYRLNEHCPRTKEAKKIF